MRCANFTTLIRRPIEVTGHTVKAIPTTISIGLCLPPYPQMYSNRPRQYHIWEKAGIQSLVILIHLMKRLPVHPRKSLTHAHPGFRHPVFS